MRGSIKSTAYIYEFEILESGIFVSFADNLP